MAQTADQILAGYYANAATRLREMILHPYGKSDTARTFNLQRASQLFGQIRDLQTGLKVQAARVTGKAMTTAFNIGSADAVRQAVEWGVLNTDDPTLRGSFSVVDSAAVQLVARDAAADLYSAADSMADNATRILRKTAQLELNEREINRIIAGGIIEGKPIDAIRSLEAELVKVNDGRIVTAGAMTFDARYYAEMVIRTKTREAVTEARHERLGWIGIDLVSIVGRVSDSWCTGFLGMVFSVSGNHPKYPPLSSVPGPPFHPNCSKGTRAFVEELASPAQIVAADGVSDAHQLLGLSPANAQRTFKDLQLRQQVTEQYRKIAPLAGKKAA